MKTVCAVGHFGFGKELLNGQTIKTKIVTAELEKQLGMEQVVKIDTHGGIRSLPSVIVQLLSGFRHCENIIIFPAHNGIRAHVRRIQQAVSPKTPLCRDRRLAE